VENEVEDIARWPKGWRKSFAMDGGAFAPAPPVYRRAFAVGRSAAA